MEFDRYIIYLNDGSELMINAGDHEEIKPIDGNELILRLKQSSEGPAVAEIGWDSIMGWYRLEKDAARPHNSKVSKVRAR